MEWLKTGWSYFLRGGLVMWPLLLCSVISLALTLERWKYFHKEDSGRVFPQQFCALLRESRWQEAWQLTENTPGEMAALGRKLLSAPPQVRTTESYIVGESRQLLQHFEKGLTYLQVIVTLAPILGLLGTITGMMASFDALGTRWENPLAVTAGVGEALITTIFGLLIAIVTICCHTYFAQRVKTLAGELEQVDNTFMENADSLPQQGGWHQ